MKHRIGIMQGRLTPPEGRGIQFFPFENWENEFYTAKRLGLDDIEFIFDYENYTQNPLWTTEGRDRIRNVVAKTNVQVPAVCFDYFMRRPFYKAGSDREGLIRDENSQIIRRVFDAMKELDIGLIEIPLVDDSSLKNDLEKRKFKDWLLQIVEQTDTPVRIALETDLGPQDFAAFLMEFDGMGIGANYDSGNSSGSGYDSYEEVTVLGDSIYNIHIKDRVYHGTTVAPGTGSADFDRLFRGLGEIKYRNNFILQAARGIDGEEEKTIASQMEFVNGYIKKYGLQVSHV